MYVPPLSKSRNGGKRTPIREGADPPETPLPLPPKPESGMRTKPSGLTERTHVVVY